jgi:hypothetical protein
MFFLQARLSNTCGAVLKVFFKFLAQRSTSLAGWQSGYAAACKAVDAGSIPTPASKHLIGTCHRTRFGVSTANVTL